MFARLQGQNLPIFLSDLADNFNASTASSFEGEVAFSLARIAADPEPDQPGRGSFLLVRVAQALSRGPGYPPQSLGLGQVFQHRIPLGFVPACRSCQVRSILAKPSG